MGTFVDLDKVGGGGTGYIGVFDNYTALITAFPTAPTLSLAYVQNSQGTPWLPGSLLGNFYSKGTYLFDGVSWVDGLDEVSEELQNILDTMNTQDLNSVLIEGNIASLPILMSGTTQLQLGSTSQSIANFFNFAVLYTATASHLFDTGGDPLNRVTMASGSLQFGLNVAGNSFIELDRVSQRITMGSTASGRLELSYSGITGNIQQSFQDLDGVIALKSDITESKNTAMVLGTTVSQNFNTIGGITIDYDIVVSNNIPGATLGVGGVVTLQPGDYEMVYKNQATTIDNIRKSISNIIRSQGVLDVEMTKSSGYVRNLSNPTGTISIPASRPNEFSIAIPTTFEIIAFRGGEGGIANSVSSQCYWIIKKIN